jgi:hypothetical protein
LFPAEANGQLAARGLSCENSAESEKAPEQNISFDKLPSVEKCAHSPPSTLQKKSCDQVETAAGDPANVDLTRPTTWPATEEVDKLDFANKKVMILSLTVHNIDYPAIVANEGLHNAFAVTVKEVLAQEIGDGILPKNIQVTLSKGSVVVHAAVALPNTSKINVPALQAAFSTSETFPDNLVEGIQNIRGIVAAITGPIYVSDFLIQRDEEPSGTTASMVESVPASKDLQRNPPRVAPGESWCTCFSDLSEEQLEADPRQQLAFGTVFELSRERDEAVVKAALATDEECEALERNADMLELALQEAIAEYHDRFGAGSESPPSPACSV